MLSRCPVTRPLEQGGPLKISANCPRKSQKKVLEASDVRWDRGTPVPYLNMQPVFLTRVEAVVCLTERNGPEGTNGKRERDKGKRGKKIRG